MHSVLTRIIAVAASILFLASSGCITDGPQDASPPKVVSVSPANGETNVSVKAAIAITFNEIMRTSRSDGFELKNGRTGAVLALDPSSAVWGFDGRTLSIRPSEPGYSVLLPATTYQLRLLRHPDIADRAGNRLTAEYLCTFTTRDPATVSSVTPANRSQDVTLAPEPKIVFDSPMDTMQGNVSRALSFSPPLTLASIKWKWGADGKGLQLTLNQPLKPETLYKASLNRQGSASFLLDSEGAPVSEYQWQFTTRNTTQVASISPARHEPEAPLNAPIVITFDRPMGTSQDVNTFITVSPWNESNKKDWKWVNGTTLRLGSLIWDPRTTYTVEFVLKNEMPLILDSEGSPVAGFSSQFKTRDATFAVSFFPMEGEQDVPIRPLLRIRFGHDMNTSSAAAVAASPNATFRNLTWPDARTLEFQAARLDAETNYNVTVRGVVDSEGIRLAPVAWSFRTRDPPSVVEFTPQGDDLPLDTQITITFSRDMNHSSVEYHLTVIRAYPDWYTFSWDARTLHINFNRLFYYGWESGVIINGSDNRSISCAEDSEGVYMKNTFVSSFRVREANIEVVSTSVYHAPGSDYTQVYGELKNKEANGIDNVRFDLIYLFRGNVVETIGIELFDYLSDDNNGGLLHIEPSCVTPFSAPLPYSFGPIDSVRIDFTSATFASNNPLAGYAINDSAGEFNATLQKYYVNGTLRNIDATLSDDLSVNAIATFYRSDGTVVGVGSMKALVLRRGETRHFHIEISSDECDVSEITQYRVQVAGWWH